MRTIIQYIIFAALSLPAAAQSGWSLCRTPLFGGRVDDVYMVNTQTGYAVCGDGTIVKTTDGGSNWTTINAIANVYNRSVEFTSLQKGFVGGFEFNNPNNARNILRRTTDGGSTWTDLTPLLHPRARQGICGLAAPDSNTIYGCGNWYKDSAYIVKSADGGNTWSFIDMSSFATSLIDMHFISKDTGFVTGKGRRPLETAVILYTTDGGASWTYRFNNTQASEYCWKIQRLTASLYFASIEDRNTVPAKILKSTDGGMSWQIKQVSPTYYYIEGVGFINPQKGWTGGEPGYSFETKDGGDTWNRINVCPSMNRVYRVNDTLVFASGDQIWKYTEKITAPPPPPPPPAPEYTSLQCSPNPANNQLTAKVSLAVNTRVLLQVFGSNGMRMMDVVNADLARGTHTFRINTQRLAAGVYYVVLKTHEDKKIQQVAVGH